MLSARQRYALKHNSLRMSRWELSASDLDERFGLLARLERHCSLEVRYFGRCIDSTCLHFDVDGLFSICYTFPQRNVWL